MNKRISKRSKILTAALLLYGFRETLIYIDLEPNQYILTYIFNREDPLTTKSISIIIHKFKAKYRILLSNNTTRPITKNSLVNILSVLNND